MAEDGGEGDTAAERQPQLKGSVTILRQNYWERHMDYMPKWMVGFSSGMP